MRGSHLARNTILNLFGQGIPLLVAFFTIPFLTKTLGSDRFGVIALSWVILNYFAVFDLGLGRATTKFIAAELSRGNNQNIPSILRAVVRAQYGLGIVGGLVLAGFTPYLVERTLKIPYALWGEAKATFYILAVAIPVVLVSGSYRGSLEAAQRFDLVNAVAIPSGLANYLMPVVAVLLRWGLPGTILLLVIIRILGLTTLWWLANRTFSSTTGGPTTDASLLGTLLRFGGWVTVSGVVGPILVYSDRFFIGSLLGLAAVSYYSAPYEMVTRLWIIPGSLVATLFPAFSNLDARGQEERTRITRVFFQSVRYLLLGVGSIAILLVSNARNVLGAWLGPEYATESSATLQVFAVAVLINSAAQVPFTLVQAVGRPDLTAKLHLLEVPIYVVLAWTLITRWGVAGAAVAWLVRVTLDALLLFVVAARLLQMSTRMFFTEKIPQATALVLILAAIGYGLSLYSLPMWTHLISTIIIFLVFAGIGIRLFIPDSERERILQLLKAVIRSS